MPWYTLLLALWLTLVVGGTYWLKYKILWFLWYILHSIPILNWLARPIIALVLFPWVFLHEHCHALMAKLSGKRVNKMALWDLAGYPQYVGGTISWLRDSFTQTPGTEI